MVTVSMEIASVATVSMDTVLVVMVSMVTVSMATVSTETVLVVLVTGGEVEGACCGRGKSRDWAGHTPFESELLGVEWEVKKERRVEVFWVLRRLAVDCPPDSLLLKTDPAIPLAPPPPSPLCTVTSPSTVALDAMNADSFACLPSRRTEEIEGHRGEGTSLSPANSATMGQWSDPLTSAHTSADVSAHDSRRLQRT